MIKPIYKKDILIVTKLSKFAFDLQRFSLTPTELIEKYKKEGANVSVIVSSHKRQQKALQQLEKIFSKNQFIRRQTLFILRDELTKAKIKDVKAVISFGGDNHFQYVAHFLDKQFLIGMNSDPARSDGALAYFTVQDIKRVLKKLEEGDFLIEEWTRLQIEINNKKIETLAVCEVFVGETARKDMSRHILLYKGKKEEQKSSGILIATGAGSTGWYDSSVRYLYRNGNKFSKTEKTVRFLVTEPYRGKISGFSLLEGELLPDEKLTIQSLNDSSGKILIDAQQEFDFQRGSTCRIQISKEPLRVIKLKGSV